MVSDELVKAVGSGRRRAMQPTWRRVDLRRLQLKAGLVLQVTTYDDTQAYTRNVPWDGAGPGTETAEQAVDALLAEPFGNWHVQTLATTLQVRVTKSGDAQVHENAAAGPPAAADLPPAAAQAHDRVKPHLVDPAEPFLVELGVSDQRGHIRAGKRDKYGQVEAFVRALDAAVSEAITAGLLTQRPIRVIDLGCGNAYLTFAAYRHLAGARGLEVELLGVDRKTQARAHNEAVAQRLGWSDHVRFVDAAIDDPEVGKGERTDIVLALHACDTATDDALARAVKWGSDLVLAAPCCHHDLQKRLRNSGITPPGYSSLTRYGILRERLADVLTDTLRANLLRLSGYRVEVMEFVDSKHTPRNVLLRGVRTDAAPAADLEADYRHLTSSWGVTPRLAELLTPREHPDGRYR
jgi:SAM-dependent methyltransferase